MLRLQNVFPTSVLVSFITNTEVVPSQSLVQLCLVVARTLCSNPARAKGLEGVFDESHLSITPRFLLLSGFPEEVSYIAVTTAPGCLLGAITGAPILSA